MGASGTIALASGLASLFLIVLYTIESHRGARFLEPVRAVFDRMLSRSHKALRTRFPELNSFFFQELFYYILHLTLSRVLFIIRKLEHGVVRIVRFNRMQAMKLRERDAGPSPATDQHLREISEHKKAVELSPKEKAKHKEAAIEG